MTSGTRRSGRRPGDSGTRTAILTVAREQFAARGFGGTTIRGIAAGADVDAALVHHYFGSKDALFTEALDLPAGLLTVPQLLAGGGQDVGERITRFYLGLWEDPTTAAPVLAMIRSAVSRDDAAALLREFLTSRVLAEATQGLGGEQAPERVTLAMSHLVGLAMARYVVLVEPVASMDLERLVAWVSPAVQRYLTGPPPGR